VNRSFHRQSRAPSSRKRKWGSRKRRHHSKPDPRLDPTRPPDRNPDELLWKHLKADTVGRMVTTSKADFKSKVVSSMRSLQKTPEKIRSFFQEPSLQYAA
jgi:fatty-acid desaturase